MAEPSAVAIRSLDHVVLNVSDVEVSVGWFHDHFGLVAERLEEYRRGEVAFVSLRVDDSTLIDLVEAPRTGVNVDHVSLVVAPQVDLREVAESGAFEVVVEPSVIWGARGWGLGMYVRDPDGNTIELKHYEQ